MQQEQLMDINRGIEKAKKIAAATNVLYRLRIATRHTAVESVDGGIIEIFLKLVKAGGSAPLSSLTVGSAHHTVATLKEMEKNNLVKIYETPFRTYVILTARGWKVLNELLYVLA